MKIIICIMIWCLLFSNEVIASDLICIQDSKKISCVEDQPLSKSLFMITARVLVIEIAKSVTVDMVKELIMKKYHEKYGYYPETVIIKH
jgi:hypothetical protein